MLGRRQQVGYTPAPYKSAHLARFSFAALLAALAACSGSPRAWEGADTEGTGGLTTLVPSLTSVPSDVACVRVVVAGNQTVTLPGWRRRRPPRGHEPQRHGPGDGAVRRGEPQPALSRHGVTSRVGSEHRQPPRLCQPHSRLSRNRNDRPDCVATRAPHCRQSHAPPFVRRSYRACAYQNEKGR